MFKTMFCSLLLTVLLFSTGFSQSNQWMTQYTTFDDGDNGTGHQTSSVAVIAPNRFVALVTLRPDAPVLDNLFNPPGNYLVGYWDADSAAGRVSSSINGEQTLPSYGDAGQFSDWEYILDKVTLQGAWQMAADKNGLIYVANNDPAHNILVFNLNETGVVSTENRMETGSENIYGIEVDSSGYVYVVDYKGTADKTNEVKVYAPIGTEGSTWGVFGAHNDAPVTTIDLPEGTYLGITVSPDGTSLYVSASHERSMWHFTGDPVNGYTSDTNFSFALTADDTVSNGGHGTPTVLGLGYMEDPPLVFAVADTFLGRGNTGGYSYGRIYLVDPAVGTALDTIDIAEWNLAVTGVYNTGSNNGQAGGFTSVLDVDVEQSENALYAQTIFGWAVEKWIFDGDLKALVAINHTGYNIPSGFALKQNYPNPFNPTTTIEFDIIKTDQVVLEIFNTVGQKVATLVNNQFSPGSYRVQFDASGLSSGIYFYQLRAGEFKDIKKMILTR